jgi:hypothetical protein
MVSDNSNANTKVYTNFWEIKHIQASGRGWRCSQKSGKYFLQTNCFRKKHYL